MSESRLFVYGSLKRNFRHHGELRGAVFECAARTAPGFKLFRVCSYPVLVEDASSSNSVAGEVYRVTPELLAALDVFEGEDYVRVPISLRDGSSAQTYVAAREPSARWILLDIDSWREEFSSSDTDDR